MQTGFSVTLCALTKSYLFFTTFLPSTAKILIYGFFILKTCFFHPIFLHLLISSFDLSVPIQNFVFNFLNRFLAVLLLFGAIIKLSEIFIIVLRPQGFGGIFSIKIIVCLKSLWKNELWRVQKCCLHLQISPTHRSWYYAPRYFGKKHGFYTKIDS